MTRPRILLIGSSGQIAWELRRVLGCLGDLVVSARAGADHVIDLSRPQTIAPVVSAVRPDLIVNAAAYTAVDQAEAEPGLAMTVNGEAVAELALAAAQLGAALVHYSTDYVFDGSANRPYRETDPVCPQSVYGRSKLAGEQAIASASVPHLILRTSWVYGSRGNNFLRTMRRLAREREALNVVDDQLGTPTWSRHIAEATGQILVQLLRNPGQWPNASGIYHLAAGGQCSWYGFAERIIGQQRAGETLPLQQLTPIRSEQYPTAARRPAYSVLATDKLRDTFGIGIPHWTTGLELVVEELTLLEGAVAA